MKNLFALITLSTLLFFSSCSKEALLQPETAAVTDIEMVSKIANDSKINFPLVATSSAKENEIEVTVGSSFSTPTELNIDFTSSHNFTGSNLEATQNIDFTDGSGNTVTLTFGVNSYTGGNGTLDVSLALGGNNLTGLGMKTAQIVIEDLHME